MSSLNTRLIKTSENEFELRIASAESDPEVNNFLKTYEKDGKKLTVAAGDFKDILVKCVGQLEKSMEFATKEQENTEKMLKAYI